MTRGALSNTHLGLCLRDAGGDGDGRGHDGQPGGQGPGQRGGYRGQLGTCHVSKGHVSQVSRVTRVTRYLGEGGQHGRHQCGHQTLGVAGAEQGERAARYMCQVLQSSQRYSCHASRYLVTSWVLVTTTGLDTVTTCIITLISFLNKIRSHNFINLLSASNSCDFI